MKTARHAIAGWIVAMIVAVVVIVVMVVPPASGTPNLVIPTATAGPTATSTPPAVGGLFPPPVGVVSETTTITDSGYVSALLTAEDIWSAGGSGDIEHRSTNFANIRLSDASYTKYAAASVAVTIEAQAILDELRAGYADWKLQGYFIDGFDDDDGDTPVPALIVVTAATDAVTVTTLPDPSYIVTPTFITNNAMQGITQSMTTFPSPPDAVPYRAHAMYVSGVQFEDGYSHVAHWFMSDEYYRLVIRLSQAYGTYHVLRP